MPSKRINSYSDNTREIKKKHGLIYYWYGASLILLNGLTSDIHKHYPIEIYIGLDEAFQVNFGNRWRQYRCIIIDSNLPHQIKGGCGCIALLLLDPKFYGLNNLPLFKDQSYYQPTEDQISLLTDKIKEFGALPYTCAQAKTLTNEIVFSLFGLCSAKGDIDPRVDTLLNRLEHTQEKLTISDLAKAVNLSESRLAHLFKEQTGTPIRRYLLWLKLRRAIKMIIAGSTFTYAAHQSGFADSAHLSRTYRQMFGVSPSELLKSYQPIKIISSFD